MERGSFIELASFERLPRARDKIAGHVYAELSRKRAFVPERVQAPSLLCGPAQESGFDQRRGGIDKSLLSTLGYRQPGAIIEASQRALERPLRRAGQYGG
jgi:hypothetical protein